MIEIGRVKDKKRADQRGSCRHDSEAVLDVQLSRAGAGVRGAQSYGGFGRHEVYRVYRNYRLPTWPGDRSDTVTLRTSVTREKLLTEY